VVTLDCGNHNVSLFKVSVSNFHNRQVVAFKTLQVAAPCSVAWGKICYVWQQLLSIWILWTLLMLMVRVCNRRTRHYVKHWSSRRQRISAANLLWVALYYWVGQESAWLVCVCGLSVYFLVVTNQKAPITSWLEQMIYIIHVHLFGLLSQQENCSNTFGLKYCLFCL